MKKRVGKKLTGLNITLIVLSVLILMVVILGMNGRLTGKAIVSSGIPGIYYIDDCGKITSKGTYILTKDLIDKPAPCIKIKNNDVILDGRGHLISGKAGTFNWVDIPSGIVVYSYKNITIKNISVFNFNIDSGIYLLNAKFVTITNSRIQANKIGIYLSKYSHDNLIINNIIYNNSFLGIRFWDTSTFNPSDVPYNNIIKNNKIIKNGISSHVSFSAGIGLYRGKRNTFQENIICNNVAVDISCSTMGTTDNVFISNSYDTSANCHADPTRKPCI